MNRKKILLLTVACITATLFLTSCYKDKGNYDYIELNQITFSGIDEYYRVNMGDPLRIYPEMEQTVPGDEDYFEYLWLRVGSAVVGMTWDTIHREKYVDNVPLYKLTPSTTDYRMIYQVIDTKHNVTYTSDYFKIKVDNYIKPGFMLLLNDGGETDLRLLNYLKNASEKIMTMTMIDVNLRELPDLGVPVGIITYADNNAPNVGGRDPVTNSYNGLYAISVATETGLYRLRAIDLHYEDIYNGKYVMVGDLTGFRVTGQYASFNKSNGANATALLRDETYNFMYYEAGAATMGNITIPWTRGINCNRYMIDNGVFQNFTPFQMPAITLKSVLLFDMDSRSFAFKAGGYNYCTKYSDSRETEFLFNNTTFDPIWLSARSSGAPNAFAIVKDMQMNEIKLLRFVLSTGVQSEPMTLWPFVPGGNMRDELPGIENAKLFAINPSGTNTSYLPLLWYAVNSKLYVFNMTDLSVEDVTPAQILDGEKIIDLKIICSDAVASATNDFVDHMVIVTEGSGSNSTSVGLYEVSATYGRVTLKTLGYDGGEKMDCIWRNLPKYVGIDWKAI